MPDVSDHLADQIELRLVTEGVDVYSPLRVGRRSSVALATIDADGNASYEFDLTFNLAAGHDRFHLEQAGRALAALG